MLNPVLNTSKHEHWIEHWKSSYKTRTYVNYLEPVLQCSTFGDEGLPMANCSQTPHF